MDRAMCIYNQYKYSLDLHVQLTKKTLVLAETGYRGGGPYFIKNFIQERT
jgi:hypothetical protein